MSVIYHVKRPTGERLEPEENLLVWFGNSPIKDCHNAMVLHGGDVLLLKTIEQISRTELLDLVEDYEKWKERFGEGLGSDQLRAAVRQSYKANK